MGEFRYQCRIPGVKEAFSTIIVYPKQEIFGLYTSFELAEIKRPRKELLRKLMIPLLILPVAFYLFYDNALNKENFGGRQIQKSAPMAPSGSPTPAPGAAPLGSQALSQSQTEFEQLRAKLEEKERVFLDVVLVGDKKMTIDPETNAYVEVRKIPHRVTCLGELGLNCYFDRPVHTVIRVAGSNDFGYSPSGPGLGVSTIYAPQGETKTGGDGAFIEAEIVPAPDRER